VDPGLLIPLSFAAPAIIAATGAVWLGARFLNRWSERRDTLRSDIDRLEGELSELHERLDFHERMLKEIGETGRLGRGE
jgi:membrane protein implicated in regulation of membrane protease activity